MWFKQIQLFQFDKHIAFDPETLNQKLQALTFTPCLPSLPASLGWVPPIHQQESLVAAINGCMMICLQFEEKVLPAAVIRQQLDEKIKELETQRDGKVAQKEKQSLKEEITHTLLTKAFSKLTRIHAYIDTKNNWLIINSTHPKKTESLVSFLKRGLDISIQAPEIKKTSPVLTQWLTSNNCPSTMNIEKACVLQDPNQKNRIIRAQQQNLFSTNIQGLLKEGCAVQQLSFSWQDRISLTLTENFSLRSLRFHDDIINSSKESEGESPQQKFAADMMIMSNLFSEMLQTLLSEFAS